MGLSSVYAAGPELLLALQEKQNKWAFRQEGNSAEKSPPLTHGTGLIQYYSGNDNMAKQTLFPDLAQTPLLLLPDRGDLPFPLIFNAEVV